jgi:nitrite reductase/ring-hydroxylating ferredoxin subunit
VTLLRPLCRLAEIPDGSARGFGPIFAVRRGDAVFAYVNACPHLGVSLNLIPDRFLDHRGTMIVCALHGALFRIEDGYCIQGPCWGESLEPVPAEVDGAGMVMVPAGAGL